MKTNGSEKIKAVFLFSSTRRKYKLKNINKVIKVSLKAKDE
jgi:hypothetical protein|tara:strand:+ start:787 stop:909 length:123 start_codon:yes stop_codon:yes gene_type:complete